MAWRGWPVGPVEVVGDRLGTEAAVGVQVEDLGDHGRLLGIGLQRHAGLLPVAAVTLRQRVLDAAIAVRGAATGAVALLAGLLHPALGLAGELVALELVPELLHADEETALGVPGSPAPVA